MTFAGLLGPFWENLSCNLPQDSSLSGQEVTLNCTARAFIAVDKDDRAHLLLSPAPEKLSNTKRFNLKGLGLQVRSWIISGLPMQKYLDITCSGNKKSFLRRPFSRFCEDVLFELESFNIEPEAAIAKSYLRWRKFWATQDEDNFTSEWYRGLLGELKILESLIQKYGCSPVAAWTGPDGNDHDFQAFRIGVEVKTSVTVPPILTINNLKQLDPSLFDKLFVAVMILTPSETGTNIVDTIRSVETLLETEGEALDRFWSKLQRVGYRRHLDDQYISYCYSIGEPRWYLVDKKFPKITIKSFRHSIDKRIRRVQYAVEIAGLSSLNFERAVSGHLAKLCKS